MSGLFATTWFPALVARIFAVRPIEFIFEWAERVVLLTAKMAAEPGMYKSAKTPWTRRLQYLAQHPFHNGRRIRKFVAKKCSQSGFTEAVLNVIRWFAKFAPRNVIYAIDSREEATNIQERLVPTLEALGEEIFTGRDDDMGKFKLVLAHMIVWFFGSFSAGKFANKQATFCVSDEVEEHAKLAGDTSTVDNLDSRLKTAEDGFHAVISKPKLEVVKDGKVIGGLICAEHARGNQEIFLVPCPFCGTYQELALERLRFDHCKNMLDEWDRDRVLRETGFECVATYCKKLIPERYKPSMIDNEYSRRAPMFGWFPTNPAADPEIISQHISDFYSLSSAVSWGRLALKIIDSKGNHVARQGVYNHNFGLGWRESGVRTEAADILKCKGAYRRSEIPFVPVALILGGDVGKAYAKWDVIAFNEANDAAVVDWGVELAPADLAEIVNEKEWLCRADGKRYGITQAAVDAKHRVEDVYAACMLAPLKLWPVSGGGQTKARRASFALAQLPTYPRWLKLLTFVDRDFKTELYTERIKREVPPTLDEEEAEAQRKKMPRFQVPENVDNDFITEHTNEELKEDDESGGMEWKRKGPNHWGDCSKVCLVLWRYLTKNRKPAQPKQKESKK